MYRNSLHPDNPSAVLWVYISSYSTEEGELVCNVRHTEKWEPGVKPQPEDDVSEKLVAFNRWNPADEDEWDLNQLKIVQNRNLLLPKEGSHLQNKQIKSKLLCYDDHHQLMHTSAQ